MFGTYKVAHLLGITREHEKQFRHVETELTKMGYICFAPVIYNLNVYNQYPDLLDSMCYEKLLVCDICVVVTPEHIGKSTSNRIKQAKELNKPVYVWENNDLKLYSENENYIKIFNSNEEEELCKYEIKESFEKIIKYCKDREERHASCIGCPIRKNYGTKQPEGCKLNQIDRPSVIKC